MGRRAAIVAAALAAAAILAIVAARHVTLLVLDVPERRATLVVKRSQAQGEAVAHHVLTWAEADGGATVENMGFPLAWDLPKGDGLWVPTSRIVQQQLPLLPRWGGNRTFATPDGAACPLPPPPVYSDEPGSAFMKEAEEVLEARRNMTEETRAIARFWSDDPMLSPTPPGHWISIADQVLQILAAVPAVASPAVAAAGFVVVAVPAEVAEPGAVPHRVARGPAQGTESGSARGVAEAEGDRKNLDPELKQVAVEEIARAQPLELERREPAREPDGEGREDDVERDRERELDA